MDLRTGLSIWQQATPAVELPSLPLDHDHSCDVLIVGGGITGALAAESLAAAGLNVAVVDKRPFAAGSTVASTGLLMYELDVSMMELQSRGGWEHAFAAYHASRQALLSLEDRIQRLEIDCGYVRRKSLYLASRAEDVQSLHEEAMCRRKAGFAVDFLAADEVESIVPFKAPAALLSELAGEVDPSRLTHGLLHRAARHGARLYPLTEVTLEPSLDRIAARTRHGPSLLARSVILAAGYEMENVLGWRVGSLHSTYVVASLPMSPLPWANGILIWESARPYLYARTTEDQRVLVGGGDVPFRNPKARDGLLPRKIRELKERFQRLSGGVALSIDHAWTGTFGESDDGLPIIGEAPDRPRIYIAAGYGGNGITFGTLAADILSEACRDRCHPQAEIFAPTRLLSASR